MSKAIIVCGWMFCVACATGGGSDGERLDAAVIVRNDANSVTTADATVRVDSGVGQDAQVSQSVDAGTGSGGLFCQTNSQCTVGGECCVTLGGPNGFCAPGTVILGECFPE